MDLLMGIDLGSTSTKAVIYDTDGKITASAGRPTEIAHLDPEHPTWAFWEPNKVWNDTVAVIKETVDRIPDISKLKGIAVTGMGMDAVPIDEKGKWLYPFISWHCPRTEPQSRAFSERVGLGTIFRIAGKQVLTIDTIYRMIWLKENHPEIHKNIAAWLLIEDFVNFMLCGRKSTDYTMASCSSLLDQTTRTWSKRLIAEAGMEEYFFPEILPSGTILGGVTAEVAALTGLNEGTPVVLGGHDYICAALAVGAFLPGVMMDITGTWEIVVQPTSELVLNENVFQAGLISETHVVKDTWLITGYCPSALMLEWFKDNYGYEEEALQRQTGKSAWDYLMEKAENTSLGANGVFFMPHFAGAGGTDQ